MLAETASDLLGKVRERRFETGLVGSVFTESVLVADGFGRATGTDFGVEPAAGVEALRLAGEGQTPLAKAGFEDLFIEQGEVADAPDAERLGSRGSRLPSPSAQPLR